MQTDRRNRVRELFDLAQAQSANDRAKFLREACPDDEALRDEVELLLGQDVATVLTRTPLEAVLGQGTKLGSFELRERIGRGGMGEVWRAYDPRLKREVAIKVLPVLFGGGSDRIARFEREARTAGGLNHPNIVSVFDIGREGSRYWIVSELVDGDSLRELLGKGPLSQRAALDIAVQIARALAAAHAAGIIHRDLKPGNVMLHRDGRVKLVDFGLARYVEGPSDSGFETGSGMVLGTAGYMAPEQVRGETVDHRCDLFSFGVVLYEMLCGKRAFAGTSAVELMHAILSQDPAELPATVPSPLAAIVQRCLEKTPGKRFQSAGDLAFALQLPSAPASPSSVSGLTQSRSGWMMTALVLALVMSLAVAAVLAFLQLTRPLPAPRVTGIESITMGGRIDVTPEAPLLLDGSRLFFWQSDAEPVLQVSIKGGELVPVNLQLDKPNNLMDISPDHAEFLVCRAPEPSGVCQLWVEPTVGGTPRRLGSLESDEADGATWSPDGRFLVYSRNGAVSLASRDGAEIRKLASFTEGFVNYLRWSPDSARIRFTVESGPDRLWEVRPDGTGLRRVLPDWNPSESICCGAWTPDGRYFVFLSNGKIWVVRDKAGFLQRAKNEPVALEIGPLSALHPVPSADGKRLFFQGFQPRSEYLRYDVKAGGLTSEWPRMSAGEVEFSRDGRSIVFASNPGQVLFKAAADGSRRVQLTSAPMVASMPRWSPDGKQIAFFGQIGGARPRVYTLSVDGSGLQQVTHGESGRDGDWDPSWSPDGTSLAFGGSGGTKPEPELIHVLDLKTGRISGLPGSQGMFSPRWSPDGRSIAGLSGAGNKLVLYDLQTKRQTVLVDRPTGYPSWSPDAKFLFSIADEGWWRVNMGDRKVDLLSLPKGFTRALNGWFVVDPGGSLITARNLGSGEIYALNWDLP